MDFQPLKGQIDPEKSSFVVGKVKVEIRLVKLAQGRWGGLIGDAPDRTSLRNQSSQNLAHITLQLSPILPLLSPLRPQRLGRPFHRPVKIGTA